MNYQLPNSSFAVLYRTNAQSRSMEEALRKLNIPYRIYGGLSFYSRKEIKDLLAYFRLTINHNDEDALQRAINQPSRGIGKTSMEKMIVAADEYNVNLWEVINDPGKYHVAVNSGIVKKVTDFATMIKSFRAEMKKKEAFEVARHIAVSSGILKLYREEDTPEGISRVENIEELLNAIKEFSEAAAEQNEGDLAEQGTLEEFMQNVALLTDADKDEDNNDKVSLMTIHAAKGLEFPNVFIVGLEENLFPSIHSINSRADLEEERRLFYVALTRAMNKVTLSYAESRYQWGQFTISEPSRFLEEIDDSLFEKPKKASIQLDGKKNKPEKKSLIKPGMTPLGRRTDKKEEIAFEASDTSGLQTGMQVEHSRFGLGKVMAIEGQGPNKKATVYFNAVGKKNLLLRFARLKIIT